MNAIEVDLISKEYASRKVLDEVSFQVKKGSIHGLLGPNGAGKTTTLKIIANLIRSTSGEVKINGKLRSIEDQCTAQELGFLLENSPLYPDMAVKEYLEYVAKLRGVKTSKLSQNIDYCINALELGQVYQRGIENLSRGFKQRVSIAQALIHMPEIVILDEPTIGLDPQSVIDIRELILDLKQAHTIVLSSHLLHEMSLVCDNVTIIANGTVKETGTLSDLRKRMSSKVLIHLKTLLRKDEFTNYLIQHPDILEVNVEEMDQSFTYHLQYTGENEVRDELLEKAIEYKLRPIGLEQTESSLEEIFMRITN